MKRSIFTALMIVCMVFLLAGCGCEHDWVEADCTNARTCIACQETEGEPLGHVWQDATRYQPMTCEACGRTEGSVLSLQEAFPEGKLRFENGRFLMNTEDLLALYLEDLNREGYDFVNTGMSREMAENYWQYYLENSIGQTISVAVVTDSDTGLIYLVSAGCPMDIENLDAMNSLLDAVTLFYDTCHGAMTDAKWEEMARDEQLTYMNDSLMYRRVCDGLGQIAATSVQRFEMMATPDMTLDIMR